MQSINKGGYATILAYKDARADINRLDAVCTPLGWKREHTRDNHNCIVSIWDSKNNHWVSKEDTGTESNTEQQKGLASDSFKRSCFNWGIGIELYDYPLIQVKLNADELDKTTNKPTWNFKLKEWVWHSEFIEQKLVFLSAKDQKGALRFSWGQPLGGQQTPSKPNLRANTKEYRGVFDGLRNGYTMDQVKGKYEVSKEIEAQLLKELGV